MPRKATLKIPSGIPEEETSHQFLQGMMDRRCVGFFKYGSAFNKKSDFMRDIPLRIKKYRSTGNTEWLLDVATFAWLEFLNPSHPDAHFRPTDDRESPGVHRKGEVQTTKRHVNEL